jgi:biotin transporter BioY
MNKKYASLARSLAITVLGTISFFLWLTVIWINTPLLGGVEGGILSLPGPVIGFLLGVSILFSLATYLVGFYKALKETDLFFLGLTSFAGGVYFTLLLAIAFQKGLSGPNFGLLLWWGGLSISLVYAASGWTWWSDDRKPKKKALES